MGIKIGKAVKIKRQIETYDEDGELRVVDVWFKVLPPTKAMAQKIAQFKDNPEDFDIEQVFAPDEIAPLIKGWGGFDDGELDEAATELARQKAIADGMSPEEAVEIEVYKPLPCNKENLTAMCNQYPSIHAIIIGCLYEAVPRRLEESTKNSLTSPAGISDQKGQDTV